MTLLPSIELDATDARLLAALRADGRQSIAEPGRRVSMSASAVAEPVRSLEEAPAVTGYRAVLDPERLGHGILAHLRLRYPSSVHGPLHELLAATPEVIEAHHVTGNDRPALKVIATSTRHLELVSGRIGSLATSVASSSPVPARAIPAAC